MDQTQSLHTIAQLAISLAGFTGIVSAVQSGDHVKSERAVRQLLETSLGVAFYAFFPLLIISLVATEDCAWRWSNALLAFFHTVTLLVSIKRAKAVGGAVVGEPDTFLHHLTRAGGIVTIGFHCAAAFNFVPWQISIYLWGLLYLLLMASHTFVNLLLSPANTPQPTAEKRGG